MFLQSLVKLNNSISVRNFAPNSDEDQKKKKSSPHSGSLSVWNFRFLVAKGYCLPENQGGHTRFAPFSVRPERVLPPRPTKIDAYGSMLLFTMISCAPGFVTESLPNTHL